MDPLKRVEEGHQPVSMTTEVMCDSRDTSSSSSQSLIERPISTGPSLPFNFGLVFRDVYRSGYPQASNYPFIQTLQLKTIVTLVDKELPEGFQQFMDGNRITHKIFAMTGTKKAEIPVDLMKSIIACVSNRDNYPLLIHCNQGKHRTGCVVGALRKVNSWSTEQVIKEYTQYAAPKVRETDVKYLTNFALPSIEPPRPVQTDPLGLVILVLRLCYWSFVAIMAICIFCYTVGKVRIWPRFPRAKFL
ncbi:tyrosine phosphatase family-domain-containing protein [Xylariomycetidae sp. FL0641]|nr:tyrosine phosphatase family-domain-containing protein [Xylariomycetidae sp. FL0641]